MLGVRYVSLLSATRLLVVFTLRPTMELEEFILMCIILIAKGGTVNA